MLTEQELLDRDWISVDELKELMEELGVNQMDLADRCGLTYSTFGQYLYEDRIPSKHHSTIIPYLLRKYGQRAARQETGEEEEEPKTEPEEEAGQQEEQAEAPKTEGEQEDPDVVEYSGEDHQGTEGPDYPLETHPHIDRQFEHLSFERIVFRPKSDRLGEAIDEAGHYALKSGVPVHLHVNGRVLKIEEEKA